MLLLKFKIVHSVNEPYFLEWFMNESVDSLGKLAVSPVTICKGLMWGCFGGSGSLTMGKDLHGPRNPDPGVQASIHSYKYIELTAFIVYFTKSRARNTGCVL